MIHIAKPIIGKEEQDAVMEVMKSGMIASGKETEKFEEAFASYIGAKHGIACNSGTTALQVALLSMGIGKGDKVITTAYSFIASTNSIIYTEATPVFVDVDENTFNINIEGLEKAIVENPDAKALLVVHLFGQPCDMDAVMNLSQKYNIPVLEDCAQAHGAMWKDKKVGSFGKAAAFSFYPTKNMTTSEGGIVVTNDEEVKEKAKLIINHGMKIRYTHDIIGYNFRMTNIAAAIGLEQLKKINDFNSKRQKNAAFYNKTIKNDKIEVPFVEENGTHVYHQYTIKVKDNQRDKLVKLLEENKIGYGIFYPYSIPEQPCYKDMGFPTQFEKTDQVKNQVLSIPVHPSLTKEETEKVAYILNSL